MKRMFLSIVFAIMIGLGANAQSDYFISDLQQDTRFEDLLPILVAGSIGQHNSDQPAPLGDGLLVLTALGAGYAVKRRKE